MRISDWSSDVCSSDLYRHDPHVVKNIAAHIPMQWIHRVFSLMKRWGLGTYHGLRLKHIDTYLNEYVFRFNRRQHRKVSFETLQIGSASCRERVCQYV